MIVSVVDEDSMVVLIVDVVVGSAAAVVLSVVTVEDNVMSDGVVAAGLVWVLLDMVL